MIEQYIFNRINQDATLQDLLTEGGKFHLYPGAVPRGIETKVAVAFSMIGTTDTFPLAEARTVQFSIFADTHKEVVEIADALAGAFNGDHMQSSGGAHVIFSQRTSETDLGYDYDNKTYQRIATYYFKVS